MKIRDPIADYIVSDTVYVVNLVRDLYPTWQPNTNVVCTHHEDSNASLSITPQGKAYCFGCGYRATNIIELFADVHNMQYVEARKMLYEDMVRAIPVEKVQAFVRNLKKRKSVMHYLLQTRHLTEDMIKYAQLGYDAYTKRITIPILDRFGTCVNIRMYAFDGDPKIINMKGHGGFRIYPEQDLVNPKAKDILLVEGEFDALVGATMGIHTVTGTGGAGNWDDRFNWMFQNKNVFILYDNDEVGQAGAKERYNSLLGVASYVVILDPPSKKGKDLSDWWRHKTKLKTQIAKVLKTKAKAKTTCMSCGKSVDSLWSMSPVSGLFTLDVCNRCNGLMAKMKWEVVK